jgi:hypothetical protein
MVAAADGLIFVILKSNFKEQLFSKTQALQQAIIYETGNKPPEESGGLALVDSYLMLIWRSCCRTLTNKDTRYCITQDF